MGLSASMWTSVSGLISHGNKMNVVGNNIANVSTIGFKSQRMDFNDYLYISGGSTSGPVQIGAGVATYAVIGDFSQGTLESTNSVTDIAIDGEGFFKVRKPNTEQMYYTRAGDFYFNADRQLQNPEGFRLQGWKVDNSTRLTFKNESVNLGTGAANESAFQGTGTPQDIVLDSWYLEAQRTSSINFTMGLTSDGKSDKSTSTTSPLTALFDQWDASKKPPMADSAYAASSPIKVYDEGGSAHTLTVYYDQVAAQQKDADGNIIYEIEGLPAGYTVYEYCVTIPPEQDMRSYGGKKFNEATNEFEGDQPIKFYDDPVHGTNKNAGMLMTGHLIFDTAGNLVNQTAYSYAANEYPNPGDQAEADPASLGSWQSTRFSSNGLPVFCANFTGQPLANSVSEMKDAQTSQAQDFLIEIDFGLRTSADWTYPGTMANLRGDKTEATEVTKQVGSAQREKSELAKFDSTSNNGKPGFTFQSEPKDVIGCSSNLEVTVPGSNGERVKIYVVSDGGPKVAKVEDLKDKFKGDEKILAGLSTTDTDVYFVDKNGEPVRDSKGKPVQVHNNDGADLANDYRVTREVGYIFPSMLSQPQQIVKRDQTSGDIIGTEEVDLQAKKDLIYFVDPNTKNRVYVDYDATGRIIGLSKMTDSDGNPITGADTSDDIKKNFPHIKYDGQHLYADLAHQETVISYNTDFAKMENGVRGENASKAGGSSFVTQDAGQNGYPSGVLTGTNITADGVVHGYYDNGETVPLYQIALYDFHNKQGLRREGGNLYAQTKESGEARQGVAGENGFGNTKAYNIEGSNVDLSREFVNMISTQRGFQANSKGITTVDTMLETVIGMKR